MQSAISDGTRATYDCHIAKYRSFCASRGESPWPITEAKAGNFFASVAAKGAVRFETIKNYRAALSTAHEESADRHLPNPVAAPGVDRILVGIQKSLAPADQAARQMRTAYDVVEHTLLNELEPVARGDAAYPSSVMIWAALCLATFGLLRPSELLGSRLHPDRALIGDQIAFFADDARKIPLHPGHAPDATPALFVLTLFVTKNNPLSETTKIIAAATAVRAMWRWMVLRACRWIHTPGAPPAGGLDPIFVSSSGDPLTEQRMFAHLNMWCRSTGRPRLLLSGRSFRRGGATSLVKSGASLANIAKAGAWKNASMVHRYANQAAAEAAEIEASRSMSDSAIRRM